MIVTYALGSCLGVTCYDPVRRTGGLLHALLPDATATSRPNSPPAMFLDTGIPALLEAMRGHGSAAEQLEFKVFGGARVLAGGDFLAIGARNAAMMKKMVLVHRLNVRHWDVGGQFNRTIQLYLDNGDVVVRMPSRPDCCV